MNIKDIEDKIKFLELCLDGGRMMKTSYYTNGEMEKYQNTIKDDNKIKREINQLQYRKQMIIRSNKINKILNG
jgi:hypothetical protein